MKPTASPRQRRKEARPAELMAAALELFVSRGFAATRLDDVAAHAGVAKGTLYLYFDSKEALFKAVIQQGIVPILEQDAELVDSFAGTSAELLQRLVLNWWQRVSDTPLGKISRIMMSEAGNFPELAGFLQQHRDYSRARSVASGAHPWHGEWRISCAGCGCHHRCHFHPDDDVAHLGGFAGCPWWPDPGARPLSCDPS